MKVNFKKILIGGFLLTLFGAGIVVEAGHSYRSYSTTVGRLNGSGYTGYQTKIVPGQKAKVYLKNNGGYKVDVRTNSAESNGEWSRNLIAGSEGDLTNGHDTDEKVRLHFSNDITTRVKTQANGRWKSN